MLSRAVFHFCEFSCVQPLPSLPLACNSDFICYPSCVSPSERHPVFAAPENAPADAVFHQKDCSVNQSSSQEHNGKSLLHHAVALGSLPILRCLLDAGVDPAATDSAGDTAAAYAAALGFWPLAHALLEAARDCLGSAVLALNRHGLTALHYALLAQYGGSVQPGGDPAAAAAQAWARAAFSLAASDGGAKLLREAEATLASTSIADAALLARHRGTKEAVLWGLDGLVLFREWASLRAGCACPAGARGYFEVEVLRPCRFARAGFCSNEWPGMDGSIVHLPGQEAGSLGVGDDAQSWGIGGESAR